MSTPPGAELADRLARALAARGVTVGFGVPGGGANLDMVGALEAVGIPFVLAHGEAAACIMASTHGLLTGAPSPAVVTRGPGAASAVNGAAQATLDRHPLVLVSDTVPTGTRTRVPHQRLDQTALLTPATKRSLAYGPATTAAELHAALDLATAAPAGAVHLDYDTGHGAGIGTGANTRIDVGAGADLIGQGISGRRSESDRSPPAEDERTVAPGGGIDAAAERIGAARRPVVLLGLGAVEAADRVRAAVERFGAPVLTTYQGVGILPTEHDLAAGLFTNGESEAGLIAQADLLITIGLDPVEPRSAPWPHPQPVISLAVVPTVDPYLRIDIELVGDLSTLADKALVAGHDWPADAGAGFREQTRAALRRGEPEGLGPVALVETLVGAMPPGVTTTVDAGAHFLAIMPFWSADRAHHVLISNGLATMGYALPAAVGAAVARPDRPVWCLTGDGGLGMALSELETVVRLDLPVTTVVFNDSGLSLIEIKQRPEGHGGPAAVDYGTTDFSAVARGMGMAATIATTVDEVTAALADEGGIESGGDRARRPRLIDARIDPSHYRHLIEVTRG